MKQEIILTREQQDILKKLTNDQLKVLFELKNSKAIDIFIQIINYLNNYEKNSFFLENEQKLTPDQLYSKHAYARGGMDKLLTLINVIFGSEQEANRRNNERKKKKEETKRGSY